MTYDTLKDPPGGGSSGAGRPLRHDGPPMPSPQNPQPAPSPNRSPQSQPAPGQPPAPALPSLAPPSPRSPRGSPHRSAWVVWAIVLVAILIIAAWWFTHRSREAAAIKGTAGAGGNAAARAIPVVVAHAIKGDMPIYLTGLGTIAPLNTVTVRTRVDGQINTVNFIEGQMVKIGDLIAQIDPRPFQVQLTQAQGQLAKDQAALENARVDLQRYQEAAAAISQQQLATQQALVRQDEAAVKVDDGQIQSAQLNLTYSRITAPIDGRIGLRTVDPGNIVHATDTNGLAVITQLQPISLIFNLPQDVIPQIMRRISQSPPPEVDAYNRDLTTKLATGTFLAIDSQVDPTSGTVRIKATFANKDNALFPNQFVNARLLVDTLHDAVIVPSAAVQRGPETTFVYVVQSDQTVKVRNVVVGAIEGDRSTIQSGLNAGETVVTDGVDKLQDGTKVTARAAAATTRPAAATTQPTRSAP